MPWIDFSTRLAPPPPRNTAFLIPTVIGLLLLNPPPETFSVTHPLKGACCNPLSGFSILNTLYPYVYYQCIAMGLLFPLIPKKYHLSSFDITMTSYVSTPSKFWKYSQTLTIYTQKLGKINFWLKIVETCDFHRIFGKISKEMLILIHLPNYKHISCQIYLL